LALTDPVGNFAGKFGTWTNWIKSPEYQVAERAQKDFLAVVLRKDSGAQISRQEVAEYTPTYFPVPGDDAPVIASKRRARQLVLDSMRFSMGDKSPFLENAPGGAPPPQPQAMEFDDPTMIPEGATVEDETGARFMKRGGQLVPVQ
jgi:hypothetical protein